MESSSPPGQAALAAWSPLACGRFDEPLSTNRIRPARVSTSSPRSIARKSTRHKSHVELSSNFSVGRSKVASVDLDRGLTSTKAGRTHSKHESDGSQPKLPFPSHRARYMRDFILTSIRFAFWAKRTARISKGLGKVRVGLGLSCVEVLECGCQPLRTAARSDLLFRVTRPGLPSAERVPQEAGAAVRAYVCLRCP